MPERGREGARPGAHAPQVCAGPLMMSSQDPHKKGHIKPFLQDGRAARKIDSIKHRFVCEFLGLFADFPAR